MRQDDGLNTRKRGINWDANSVIGWLARKTNITLMSATLVVRGEQRTNLLLMAALKRVYLHCLASIFWGGMERQKLNRSYRCEILYMPPRHVISPLGLLGSSLATYGLLYSQV